MLADVDGGTPSRRYIDSSTSSALSSNSKKISNIANMSSRIVLITGANTGLGFEIVKALSRSSKPYTVLVGGRSIEKAKAAVREAESLKAASSTQLQAVQIDIEDDASISSLSKEIEQQHGRLDVLINNAGKYLSYAASEAMLTNISRRPIRPTSPRWQHEHARHVEQIVVRQHNIYVHDYTHVGTLALEILRSTPPLHHKWNLNTRRAAVTIALRQIPSRRLAKAHAHDPGIPVCKDGTEHDDAGVGENLGRRWS
jgi:NAD(P)-dependent dehydrogenase (short-subunit alcohol dehydrogenase family)